MIKTMNFDDTLNKNIYEVPTLEILVLGSQDVVTFSTQEGGGQGGSTPWSF